MDAVDVGHVIEVGLPVSGCAREQTEEDRQAAGSSRPGPAGCAKGTDDNQGSGRSQRGEQDQVRRLVAPRGKRGQQEIGLVVHQRPAREQGDPQGTTPAPGGRDQHLDRPRRRQPCQQ